jgi:hypothetical protein
MELQYDYKSVDWKAVKSAWDKSPVWFELNITHVANVLTFQSGLDKSKRYRLMVYVNGQYKGEWHTDGHPNQKYFNAKTKNPGKKRIDIERKFERKCKKMTDAQIIKAMNLPVFSYTTPVFDNLAQIKKMVTALE